MLVTGPVWTARRRDTAVAALIALTPLAVFGRALAPGRVLSPLGNLYALPPWAALAPADGANPALGDVTQVFHPWLLYAARAVAAGRLPFWNPYEYAGAPFFSNAQTATLFPLTALAYVLPAALALTLIAVLKSAIAGVGTYAFLRSALEVGRTPAAVAALGFMLGVPMVGWLPWTFASTTMLLPWLLLAVDRARDGGSRRVAALAIVVALAALAGYPQGAFTAALVATAWAFARARGAGGASFLARAAFGGLLGLGLAAVQWLPFLDYARESAVVAYRAAWTATLTVPPSAALTLTMPLFFGAGRETWSLWQFNITSLSVGLLPLLAAPAVALSPRRRGVAFFAGLGALASAMHFGAPGLRALASAPGVALGTNLRLMPLIAWAICVLGALGLDGALARPAAGARMVRITFVAMAAISLVGVLAWAEEPRAQAMSLPAAVQYGLMLVLLTAGALATLAWIARPSAWTAAALVATQAASVVPLAALYWPVTEARWLYPTPPAIAWLAARDDHARSLMPGDLGLLYGVREAHGYDGLTPRRIERLLGPVGTGEAALEGFDENPLALHGSEPLAPGTVLLSGALDRAGVRYVVLPPGTPAPRPGWTVAYDAADARIYVNPGALPRARVPARVRCADDATALAALRGGRVGADEALVAECTENPPASGGEAAIVIDEPERTVVRASAPAPATLVLSDTWFPGWRARIDGREAPLVRADYAFRAVALPAGRHEIEFTFRPRWLATGAMVSALALVIVTVLAVPWRMRG